MSFRPMASREQRWRFKAPSIRPRFPLRRTAASARRVNSLKPLHTDEGIDQCQNAWKAPVMLQGRKDSELFGFPRLGAMTASSLSQAPEPEHSSLSSLSFFSVLSRLLEGCPGCLERLRQVLEQLLLLRLLLHEPRLAHKHIRKHTTSRGPHKHDHTDLTTERKSHSVGRLERHGKSAMSTRLNSFLVAKAR